MIKFSDIQDAFLFVSSSGYGMHTAILCKDTGQILYHSEMGDLDEIDDDDLPNPTAFELYQLVENKEEFVEAYKQAFQASIFNSNFLSNKDFDETLESIIRNRS